MDMTVMKAPREAAADLVSRLGPERALSLALATEARTEAPRWREIAEEVEQLVDEIEAREWGLGHAQPLEHAA